MRERKIDYFTKTLQTSEQKAGNSGNILGNYGLVLKITENKIYTLLIRSLKRTSPNGETKNVIDYFITAERLMFMNVKSQQEEITKC